MVLALSTTRSPATDLGHLLRKHPDRHHAFHLTFGTAHVLFPEATPDRCTCALVRRRRGPSGEGGALDQYVNHLPGNLERLRARSVARKRSLAVREFALGVEGLERFVRREPLRRVHECVFGVLALESEPVDPRL